MPKITIREKDLTSAGNLEATTNAVYIPGYANMGPVNKPTLCETVNDFKLTFGSEPYRFRTDQSWMFHDGAWDTNSYSEYMGNYCQAGDYEKSYIMAIGLLKAGTPVVYERVFNRGTYDGSTGFSNELKWMAKKEYSTYTMTSTSPGLSGHYVHFTIMEYTQDIGEDTTKKYYKFSIRREEDQDLGIPQVQSIDTIITFNDKVAKIVEQAILVKSNSIFVDNSGLVQFKFGSGVDSDTEIDETYEIEDGIKVYKEDKLSIDQVSDVFDSNNNSWKDEFTLKDMYDYLSSIGNDAESGEPISLERLVDNGEYAIKFITSGAYPTYGLQTIDNVGNYGNICGRMIQIAANRGNSTALIDHTPNNHRPIVATDNRSVYHSVANNGGLGKTPRVNEHGEDANTFAAMFTPYGVYETEKGDQTLPASYGYLVAFSAQAQSYNNWLATAGCTRGYVPGLKSLCQNVTNAVADSYQPRNGVAINAITNIKPYGLMIWGARTLKDNIKKGDLTATSFLNIRQLTNDVKRQVWVASKYLTFEQNSDILWIKFKNKITPLLDNMVNGGGISTYEIKRQKTDKKATVKAIVRLYAVEPVEDWDITIELADSTTEILG